MTKRDGDVDQAGQPGAQPDGQPGIEPESDAMPLGARIHRLQRIAAELDRDDLELEEALRLFEEGVSHLRAAETLVSHAELRIERLLGDGESVHVEELDTPE